MNVIDLIRDATARRTALLTYARSHDRFSDAEQLATGAGLNREAEAAHLFALIALRAYRAELDDHEPVA